MKKLLMILAIGFAVPVSQASADFTWDLSGTTYNINDIATTVVLNDMGNSSGVPLGVVYTSFEVTADWAESTPDPWSSEARINLTWAGDLGGGNTGELTPVGGGNNNTPTSLSWAGNLSSFGTDYTIEPFTFFADVSIDLRQTYNNGAGTTTSDWSNLIVTFFDAPIVAPTPIETFDLTTQNAYNYNAAHAAGEVDWFEIIHGGGVIEIMNTFGSGYDTELGIYDSDGNLIAENDDTGGLQSSLDGQDLVAGTYYLAASGFNTTWGATDWGAIGGNSSGNLNLDVALTTIPEPAGGLVIAGLCGLVIFGRRRRKTA